MALGERRRQGDRRRSAPGRRIEDKLPEQSPPDATVAIAAAIIVAPRLQALELRDTVPVRNLIQQAVSLAKILVQKAEVEMARDFGEAADKP
jgi:hypothetical protein